MIWFKLGIHSVDRVVIVEIHDDEQLVGVIYPGDGLPARHARAIRVISKYDTTVEQMGPPPIVTKLAFGQ